MATGHGTGDGSARTVWKVSCVGQLVLINEVIQLCVCVCVECVQLWAACAYQRVQTDVCEMCGKCPCIGGLCVSTMLNGCVRDVWKVSSLVQLVPINMSSSAFSEGHPSLLVGMAGVGLVQVDRQGLCLGGLCVLAWPKGGKRAVRKASCVVQPVPTNQVIQLCVTYVESFQ